MIFNKSKKLQIIFLCLLLVIFLRFVNLQVFKHQQYKDRAGANSIRKISLHAPRGIIYDRHGSAMVDNLQIYDLALIPFDITDKFNYDLIATELSLSKYDLISLVSKTKNSFYRFRPKTIKRHINFETRSRLEENKLDLPGMYFEEFPARIYPNQARLTHVLGYLRTATDETKKLLSENYSMGDLYGFSGIEKVYESILRGRDGAEFHLIDIYGIDHGLVSDIPPILPISGEHLYLTIDSKLQFFIERLFENKRGAVICMNPITGDVLAYLSAPDYDLNSFVGPVPIKIWNAWNFDEGYPLLNRVIQGQYPPGSTMKLIAVALALEEQIVDREWTVNCNGAYQLGNRKFHCWHSSGHGRVNMQTAIINSCNIYFYQLIQKIPFEKWVEMAKNFGFGSSSGIDLIGEEVGNIPNTKYMNEKYGKFGWATGSLLTFVIGQGDVLTTPIQVVQMMNLIASKGVTNSPKLNKNNFSKIFQLSLQTSTWEFLENALWNVVNHNNGTGKLAKVDGIDIFGKTGTAQNPHGDDHSWFAGYMKIKNVPVISLAVLIENGGKGSIAGAKISKEIFNFYIKNDIIQ